jgi:hypothetical protein
VILLRGRDSAENLSIPNQLGQADLPEPMSLSLLMLRLSYAYFERTARAVHALGYVHLDA